MKKTFLLIISGLILLSSGLLFGQDNNTESKYGKDELECKKNLSLYVTFYKQKNYKDAMLGWRYVFSECPKSSKNIFIHGATMFSKFADDEKDNAKKMQYVDTLMLIYDRRIESFGEEALVKGKKAVDMYKYYGASKAQEVYDLCMFSMENLGNETEAAVLVRLMQSAKDLQEAGKLDCDILVDSYSKAIDILDYQISENIQDTTNQKLMKKAEIIKISKKNLDNLFVTSQCASCDIVIPLFTKKYEENIDNVGNLKNMLKLMTKRKCTNDPLYEKVLDRLFELAPDEVDPYAAAKYYAFKKEDYNKAMEYYKTALNMTEDEEEKADIYYQMASVSGLKLNQYATARNYALKAIKLKENWGDPYLLIGKLYAASANMCGETACTKNAVFWVAVDKFVKAKTIDPNCADEANKLIATYSAYYPKKEDCFFENIMEGQSYTVGCWINETTTTRFSK